MFERFERLLTRLLGRNKGIPVRQPAAAAQPLTRIAGGGTVGKSGLERMLLHASGSGTEPHDVRAKRWRAVYRTGGPVSTCIDAFPLFVLSNGFTFSCREGAEDALERVNTWADQSHVHLHAVIWQIVLDGILVGTSYSEIVPDDGAFGIWGIVPRDASMFTPIYDDYGRISEYEQLVTRETRISIPTDRLLAITPFPIPGEIYGASLVERAFDDILRDTDIYESIAVAIRRHGTQRYHVKVGQPGESITPEDLAQIKREFTEITAKNDWVTTGDVDIRNIDVPMGNLQTYSDMSLQRLAAAFGVPDEFLGRGSQGNQATATTRLRAFYSVISTIQDMVARSISTLVLDRITGDPGSVWLSFGEVSPDDFSRMAAAFSQLRTGVDPDAVIPAAWARDQLGIPPDAEDRDLARDTAETTETETGLGVESPLVSAKKQLELLSRKPSSSYIRRLVLHG